jgi:hypothetical protein
VKVKTVVRDTSLDGTFGDSFVGWPDFTYYDGENAQLVDLVRADEGSAIEAYFGVDGRLMPVCSDDRQLLYTCVERGDVYYDSGTSDLIRRLVEAGFLVIGFAIAARLLAGLLVLGLERLPWPLARPDAAPDDPEHGTRPA